jgi:hypothetical protein
LIVLDGAPDVGALKNIINTAGACDVLVTTIDAWPQSILIGSLTPEPSVISFISAQAGISAEDAHELFSCVTGLPLGIHHACDYIARNHITVLEYVGRLEENPELWTDERLTPSDFHGDLLRAATISVKMSQIDPVISKALAILGASGPSPFPVILLRHIIGNEADEVLNRLVDSFSIELDAQRKSVFMHQIVHKAIRVFYPPQELDTARRDITVAIANILPGLATDGDAAATAMLIAPHVTALKPSFPTAAIAVVLGEICYSQPFIAEELWMYAYKVRTSTDSQEASVTTTEQNMRSIRATAAARLGAMYRDRGRPSDGLTIVQTELDIANSAGDVRARSQLLHDLGHLIDELYGSAERTLQIFRQERSMLEICGSPEELALNLACSGVSRLELANRNSASNPSAACKNLSIAAADLTRAEQILEDLWNESGETAPLLTRRIEATQGLIRQKHARLSCSCDIETRSETTDAAAPATGQPSYDTNAIGSGQESTHSTLKKQFNDLRLAALTAAQNRDFKRCLEISCRAIKLGSSIYGDYSKYLKDPYFLAALSANRLGLGQETRDLAEEYVFISISLSLPSPRSTIEGLGEILGFSNDLSYQNLLRSLPRTCADNNMPALSAICWLIMQSDEDASYSSMKAILSRLRTVLAWRSGSERIAGNIIHLLGHSTYLSDADRLRCHRLATGLLRRRPDDAWALGTALYCLAHRLHAIGQVPAAIRRYKQARDIFVTFLGVDNEEVRHLDFHINNPDHPYGEVPDSGYERDS